MEKPTCCFKMCIRNFPDKFVSDFKNDILKMTNREKDMCVKTMLITRHKSSFQFKMYPIGTICCVSIQWLYDISEKRFDNILINNMESILSQNIHSDIVFVDIKKPFQVILNIEDLKCPISNEIMYIPVLASDGFNYEKKNIEEWISINQKSPMTNQKIKKGCYINLSLQCKIKSVILDFKTEFFKNPDNFINDDVQHACVEWITEDSKNMNSNTRVDSIQFLVKYFHMINETQNILDILNNKGNEKELIQYLKENNMKSELENILVQKYPLMKIYFNLE